MERFGNLIKNLPFISNLNIISEGFLKECTFWFYQTQAYLNHTIVCMTLSFPFNPMLQKNLFTWFLIKKKFKLFKSNMQKYFNTAKYRNNAAILTFMKVNLFERKPVTLFCIYTSVSFKFTAEMCILESHLYNGLSNLLTLSDHVMLGQWLEHKNQGYKIYRTILSNETITAMIYTIK